MTEAAWFIEPASRLRIVALFLLAHLVIPTANVVLVQALVASGATGANLGFKSLINSFVWGLAVSGIQALVLRRHVPARSWFWWTAASIFAVGVADFILSPLLIGTFGIDALSYYRFVLPILRWLVIASAQSLVLAPLVRSAGLWIATTVFAVVAYLVLQNALLTAGFGAVLVLPWGGLAVGAAQSWCLLQFRRRVAAETAPAAPV